MKKIISGRVYDTDTAREMACASFGYPGDVSRYDETLYRKRSGEWFLFGDGEPGSKYAERVGNLGWGSGWRIMPMTPEEARAWAEKNIDADKYVEVFGDPGEDGQGLEGGVVRLDGPTFAAVCAAAEREGVTRGEVVRRAMAV